MAAGTATAVTSQVIGIDLLMSFFQKAIGSDRVRVELEKRKESHDNLSTDADVRYPASARGPASVSSKMSRSSFNPHYHQEPNKSPHRLCVASRQRTGKIMIYCLNALLRIDQQRLVMSGHARFGRKEIG